MDIEIFQEEARDFLDHHANLRASETFEWGEGSDSVAILSERSAEEDAEELRAAKAWKASEFDAGFGWISGPGRYGGRDLSIEFQQSYLELKSRYETPTEHSFGVGLGMIVPAIMAHASDVVRDRYLRAMHRGEVVACQLFSEPGAGSDLASIETRAIRDAEGWRLNGQKVWTSAAHQSDIGLAICRTDPAVPKHQGLSAFIIDMHAPGVEVRPLRQMTGGASFNEVFLSDVWVADDHRLGREGDGWSVSITTLSAERQSIGGAAGGGRGGADRLQRVIDIVHWLGRERDPLVRQKVADLYIRVHVARQHNLRSIARQRAGETLGPEGSIAKLLHSETYRVLSETVTHLLDQRLVVDTGEWGTYAWTQFVLAVPGTRIAGGTDEIMKNILGERVLGLPKESRVGS